MTANSWLTIFVKGSQLRCLTGFTRSFLFFSFFDPMIEINFSTTSVIIQTPPSYEYKHSPGTKSSDSSTDSCDSFSTGSGSDTESGGSSGSYTETSYSESQTFTETTFSKNRESTSEKDSNVMMWNKFLLSDFCRIILQDLNLNQTPYFL